MNSLQLVEGYKIDLFSHDVIALRITRLDGTISTIKESDPDFDIQIAKLIDELPILSTWHEILAFPAFEEKYTILYKSPR